MCLSFNSSNNFLLIVDNWFVARKCFAVVNRKLFSAQQLIPYEAYKITSYNDKDYLHIVNRDRKQQVFYLYVALDGDGKKIFGDIKREEVLGYHASLFAYKSITLEANNLCFIDNNDVWLPIVFNEDNIQIVSDYDIVVNSFCIPLSLSFYFKLAETIKVNKSVATDLWFPIVSKLTEILQLKDRKNVNKKTR